MVIVYDVHKDQERKISGFVFWNQTRAFIIALSLTCLTLAQINSQIFTFTVICMHDLVDHSSNETESHWIEGTTEKSVLFSATAVGALIGLLPSATLINRLGVRLTLSICGLCSTIGTIFFPLSVALSFYLVVICRVLQGLGISMILTVLGIIPNSWCPSTEYSTYLALLSSSLQLSNVVFMPVSGVLCDSSIGWRSIYYLFGFVTGVFFLIFYFFYNDEPHLHKNVSQKELGAIQLGKTAQIREAVPYKKLITDKCVLVAWLGFIGGNLGFITLLLFGPTYLREVLHFDVKATGYINALPFFLCTFYKFGVGKISDRITFVSHKTIYTSWLLSSVGGLGLGYIVMAMTSDRLIAQIAFIFAIVASGLIIMGVVKCLQMRCLQHCHVTVSAMSFISYMVQFISPLLVGLICPDNTSEQWSKLFIYITIFMFITNIPFPFLVTEEAAEYTKRKKNSDFSSC